MLKRQSHNLCTLSKNLKFFWSVQEENVIVINDVNGEKTVHSKIFYPHIWVQLSKINISFWLK